MQKTASFFKKHSQSSNPFAAHGWLFDRHCNREGCALPGSARQFNLPSMSDDNAAGDCQAEPGAAPVAATGLIDSIEAIEDARMMFRGNPDARVLHDHARRPIGSFVMNLNCPSLRRILDGIVDQIKEH